MAYVVRVHDRMSEKGTAHRFPTRFAAWRWARFYRRMPNRFDVQVYKR